MWGPSVEYIPQMMRSWVAERMLRVGACRHQPAENRRLLFSQVQGAETFPAPGTPYFDELLENQITGKILPIPPKPNLWQYIYRMVRSRKMELG